MSDLFGNRPREREVHGELYRATVFLVQTKDDRGAPRICLMFADDDETINIGQGDEFMIAYVPVKMLKR